MNSNMDYEGKLSIPIFTCKLRTTALLGKALY